MKVEKDYGWEVILDLHECDSSTFTRKSIRNFFIELCKAIDMERCKLVWWDDLHTPEEEKETEPHLVGTSAIQFIKTSNITIHTLDILKRAYINIFSCKPCNPKIAQNFSRNWFRGKIMQFKIIRRI